MVGVVLAVVVAFGPPALPPLPGQGAPDPEPPPAARPAPDKPDKPADPAPDPSPQPGPEPAPTPAETPAPVAREPDGMRDPWATSPDSAPPAFAPPPAADDDGAVVPPQPETVGPPIGEVAPESDEDRPRPPRASEIPGGDENPRFVPLPPPERPPYQGNGMFIGAGVALAFALTGQIVGHVMIKRSCIDPAGRGEFDDVENAGEVVARCAEGVVPAVVLRVQSDLALLAMIGLTGGGAALRGRRDAYDDVFGTPGKRPNVRGMRAGGIALAATGAVTWATTAAVSWGLLTRCDTSRCANAARATAFSMRSLSAVMIAAGVGMLAYGESLRRNRTRYERERILSIGPDVGARRLGLSLTGRF